MWALLAVGGILLATAMQTMCRVRASRRSTDAERAGVGVSVAVTLLVVGLIPISSARAATSTTGVNVRPIDRYVGGAYRFDAVSPDLVDRLVLRAKEFSPRFGGDVSIFGYDPRSTSTTRHQLVATESDAKPKARPNGKIVDENGVEVVIHSNDHAPPHAHVTGGNGEETRIGQNGKPLKGDPELSRGQREVVQNNLKGIRDSIRESMRQHARNKK